MSIKGSLDELEDQVFKALVTIHKDVLNFFVFQVLLLFLPIKFYSCFYYWLPLSLAILLLMGILVIFGGEELYKYLLNEWDRARDAKWRNIYMRSVIAFVLGSTSAIFEMHIQVAMGCK